MDVDWNVDIPKSLVESAKVGQLTITSEKHKVVIVSRILGMFTKGISYPDNSLLILVLVSHISICAVKLFCAEKCFCSDILFSGICLVVF